MKTKKELEEMGKALAGGDPVDFSGLTGSEKRSIRRAANREVEEQRKEAGELPEEDDPRRTKEEDLKATVSPAPGPKAPDYSGWGEAGVREVIALKDGSIPGCVPLLSYLLIPVHGNIKVERPPDARMGEEVSKTIVVRGRFKG